MKDYSYLVSALRTPSTLQYSQAYAETLWEAAYAIEQLQADYEILAKMYDKANEDLNWARATIDSTINLALRDHEAYLKRMESRGREISGLLTDRTVLKNERDSAVEELSAPLPESGAMRLVDANDLMEQGRYAHLIYEDGNESLGYTFVVYGSVIKHAQTVDAVPVVRCADCCRHQNCFIESTCRSAGAKNPYCCLGKTEA